MHAVLVSDILPPSAAALARLARAALRRLRRADPAVPAVAITAADFPVERTYLGRCYGAVTEAGLAAQRLFAEHEAIALETTYTAKAAAALLDCAARPEWRGRPRLVWKPYKTVDHTPPKAPQPDWRTLPAPFHQFFAAEHASAAGM